ncbi:MAG: hypothetical protein ACI97A_000387 [Planctomycetota bacterium]|jgi:hypothetical protein
MSPRKLLISMVLGLGILLWILAADSTDENSLIGEVEPNEVLSSRSQPTPIHDSPATEQGVKRVADEIVGSHTATLTLKFEDSVDRNPVLGVRVVLIDQETGSASPQKQSDMDGLLQFTSLTPGAYRWQLKSGHQLEFDPPFEKKAVELIGNGFHVNPIPGDLSGLLVLKANEHVSKSIDVEPFARVVGSLAFESLPIMGRAFVKLLTREIVGEDPLKQVDRVVARQHQSVSDGRFAFDHVQSGPMELLVTWLDNQQTHRFLTHRFDLSSGTRRDLGVLSFDVGLSATLIIQPVDFDGNHISISTQLPTRVLMVEPMDPLADWPYTPKRLPIGDEFRIGGLRPGQWLLAEVGQEPIDDMNWERIESEGLVFSADQPELQVLEEAYLRKVTADLEIQIPDPENRFRVDILAVGSHGDLIVRSTTYATHGVVKTKIVLTEGPQEIIVIATLVDSSIAFAGSHRVVLIPDRELESNTMLLRPAAWIEGEVMAQPDEPVVGLAASLAHLSKKNIWIFKHAIPAGRHFRIPVLPGEIHLKGTKQVMMLRQGEVHQVGQVRMDGSGR